jgi:hypothetical protein
MENGTQGAPCTLQQQARPPEENGLDSQAALAFGLAPDIVQQTCIGLRRESAVKVFAVHGQLL